MWETQVQSLSQEDPLGKEMATHSSTLAWKIRGRRSLVGYSPWGCKESDMTEAIYHVKLAITVETELNLTGERNGYLKWL